MSKSLFKSKAFWLNVLGTATIYSDALASILPPKYAIVVLGVLNILTRLITDQPVHVMGEPSA